jgi:hypothetical protein
MEGIRRGPPNAVRHHGEEKEEEEVNQNTSCMPPPSKSALMKTYFIGNYFLSHENQCIIALLINFNVELEIK